MSERLQERAQADVVLVAFISHEGHDGLPGAPRGVLCLRCNAERALDALLVEREGLRKERDEAREQRDMLAHRAEWVHPDDQKVERDRILAAKNAAERERVFLAARLTQAEKTLEWARDWFNRFSYYEERNQLDEALAAADPAEDNQ